MRARSLKRAVADLFGLAPPGAAFVPSEGDVMLVSYPRSGNTWVRFLLANMLRPDLEVGFDNIERVVPDIYQCSALSVRSFHRRTHSPRVLKSHEPLTPHYRKVVYITRDPRDVAISYYHYQMKRREIPSAMSLDEYLERFIAAKHDQFGGWNAHIRGWLTRRDDSSEFLLLQYEKLRAHSVEELQRVATFIGIKAGDPSRAIAQSSFDSMQRAEDVTARSWRTVKNTRTDIRFVRRGEIGEGTRALSPRALELLDRAWAPEMAMCGYATVSPDARGAVPS